MSSAPAAPTEVVVEVPVRVCDVGGWTDTWFAGHGRVCTLAVGPGVTVRASSTPGSGRASVHLLDFRVAFELGSEPEEHRLVAEAVREAGVPSDVDVVLDVTSAVPAGSSLGTSASVCVGVLAALDRLAGRRRSSADLAAAAHRVEVERLGLQSGVQDQVAAAHGGANLVEVGPFPAAVVRPIELHAGMREALDERLLHVAYGGAHDSSAVHRAVIAELEGEGPSSPRLERLRDLAGAAAAALAAGDLGRWGTTLTAATDVQRSLHPGLVSPEAEGLVDLVRAAGALGWKVNGAGGSGGSISVLCADVESRDELATAAVTAGATPLALRLAARRPGGDEPDRP